MNFILDILVLAAVLYFITWLFDVDSNDNSII